MASGPDSPELGRSFGFLGRQDPPLLLN
jgi:hypothetical protein